MINMNVKVTDIPDVVLDLTNELRDSAEVVASEIRGSVKRGITNASDTGNGIGEIFLKPNAPGYAAWKMKKLGHADPLIAKDRKLISQDSYIARTVGMNHVSLNLSESIHPNSGGLSISDIGTIQHFGDSKIPARPFFGVSPAAVKRCIELITRRIQDILDGKIGVAHG